jgi:hypothetical protein
MNAEERQRNRAWGFNPQPQVGIAQRMRPEGAQAGSPIPAVDEGLEGRFRVCCVASDEGCLCFWPDGVTLTGPLIVQIRFDLEIGFGLKSRNTFD